MSYYYVYLIRDCQTKEVIYVGKGKLERAYRQIFNINGKDKMESFYSNGGEPLSLLEFFAERISNKSAMKIERDLIEMYKQNGTALLNKMMYSPHTKTNEWKEKIRLSNIGKHNHRGAKNPNAKSCTYNPTGKQYGTLKMLCEDNGLPYESVKSSLSSFSRGKQSKYHSLIKFKQNV